MEDLTLLLKQLTHQLAALLVELKVQLQAELWAGQLLHERDEAPQGRQARDLVMRV